MSTLDLGSISYTTTPDVNGNLIIYSNGGVITFSAAATGSRPAAGNAGAVFLDTSLFQLEYDNGTTWNNIGVGSVTAGAGITTSGPTGAITISNSGVTSATATSNQTTVSSATGAVTFGIADNPIIPGTADILIPVGSIAQRPTSPVEGMFRYNSDDDVLEGYSAPYSIAAAPVAMQRTALYRKRRWWVDEFISGAITSSGIAAYGGLSWTITTSSGTPANSMLTPVTDHVGIFSLGTGGSIGNNVRIHLAPAAATPVIVANQISQYTFLINIPTITNIITRFGLFNNLTTNASGTTYTDSVYFEFDSGVSGNLRFFTSSGGVTSAAVSTVTVAANTWYLVEAFYTGTSWVPVVNGVTYTAQTTNISTAPVNVGLMIQTSTGAARKVSIDYFSMITTELGARYP